MSAAKVRTDPDPSFSLADAIQISKNEVLCTAYFISLWLVVSKEFFKKGKLYFPIYHSVFLLLKGIFE